MFADRMSEFLGGLLEKVLPDLLLFAGIGALVYGVHQQSVPGAWIAGGAALILLGLGAGKPRKG